MNRILALVLAAALSLPAACDSDWTDPADGDTDIARDSVTDVALDSGDETLPCTYPEGPYAFGAVGDTVAPMSWPSSPVGMDETLEAQRRADFRESPDIRKLSGCCSRASKRTLPPPGGGGRVC